jgi:hypothetical protein
MDDERSTIIDDGDGVQRARRDRMASTVANAG